MRQLLLSLLLLCSLSAFAQDKEVKRQKKTQTTTVDQRKAEQEAARKREEAKRREQAKQEQRRKEQQERERQARIEQQRREQEERERQARLEEQRREQARREQEERERRNALHWDESQKALCYNGQTYSMVRVQGGTFNMGATSEQDSEAYDDEKPVHQVTLSSYYIGKYEVTQDLWQAVMGSNPSRFKGSRKPVESVRWDDCQTFISKLDSLTGKRFRLPTEAEWEFASRGGTMSRGYKYSGSNTLSNVAWYTGNSGFTTHDVGTKSPNELGIYDMSGNVYEWCSDWYGNYSSSSQTNPTGSCSGSNRVHRGGSWGNDARGCRVSFRFNYAPGSRSCNLGLRLVLSE